MGRYVIVGFKLALKVVRAQRRHASSSRVMGRI